MINVQAILARVDLVELVGRFTPLKKNGVEYTGLCPFHSERSPSFTVSPVKGFVHCFGCGAHHDAIGFVMVMDGCDFQTACHKLGGHDLGQIVRNAVRELPRRPDVPSDGVWVPIWPVPDDAPRWSVGVKGKVWNIKRGRWWHVEPSRADAYLGADGSLMGYVLRVEMDDGKITPAVTWCIGPRGESQWCLQPFPEPRPLFGLHDLARKPDAPVLMVEGEKCATVSAGALPMYAVACWMGGGKGAKYADWSALAGRDVVLWPDADDAGREAMLGYIDNTGLLHEGVAQLAHRAGCASLRVVDVSQRPKGWDIADAIADGWTAKQLMAWARERVKPVEIVVDESRVAV
ncbi:CHC2 zinc finger domain-containing protein [Rhodanobacter sp. BL-MT-08]